MSVADIAAAVRHMLMLTLLLASPFLAASMLASFVVGVLQASTRINDLTLSFVPRFMATMLVVYLAGAWAVRLVTSDLEHATLAIRGFGG